MKIFIPVYLTAISVKISKTKLYIKIKNLFKYLALVLISNKEQIREITGI